MESIKYQELSIHETNESKIHNQKCNGFEVLQDNDNF